MHAATLGSEPAQLPRQKKAGDGGIQLPKAAGTGSTTFDHDSAVATQRRSKATLKFSDRKYRLDERVSGSWLDRLKDAASGHGRR